VGIFGKARRLSLLRGEETLLLFRHFKQPSRGFQVRLAHEHNPTKLL
jgi:hypothetical protein